MGPLFQQQTGCSKRPTAHAELILRSGMHRVLPLYLPCLQSAALVQEKYYDRFVQYWHKNQVQWKMHVTPWRNLQFMQVS